MAFPPRDQRYQYLRFEGLQYTEGDIVYFKTRLARIYMIDVHKVQVSNFRGLSYFIAEGLSTRMLMEHRDAQGHSVFTSRAWRRRQSWRQFILALGLDTAEEIETVGFSAYWADSARQIPNKGDLRDYWIGISCAGDFLGTASSQAPEKVTVTDLFYLKGMDVGSINIPYLLARYLRRFAAGRKSEALISVVAPALLIIDMTELVRLQICTEFGDTWAYVPPGPARQEGDAGGVAEEALMAPRGGDEDEKMLQAMPPPPRTQGTTFEARVWDYMAAHTERIERFKNAIFKQREEINDRMTEMFGLLKELTTSRTPEKVLIREDVNFPIIKNVNSISLARGEEERSDKIDVATGNDIENPTKQKWGCKIRRKCHALSTYMKLTDKRLAETDIKLSLASHSYIYPLGITEDILVEVVEHVYLVDFVILGIKKDKKRPFILRTPFLTMAKAVIKFNKGTITLRSGKSKISFHRIPESFCKIERGVKNDIDPIAPTMNVNRLVMKWKERIKKLHLEREMKFNQWKSKNFKSKHHALVKVEGEMNDEGEFT
nr:hypothetical protein [Tanacetum cinerariifolium]